MCTKNEDNKCFQVDSFGDWCEECMEDWFAIIGEDND